MDSGYVRLWRCSLDSRVWNNEGLWKVWTWCLMKASYKERWEGISTGKGNTDVHLLPGQFIFGRHTAAKELKMKAPTVYDRMKKLVEIKNCTMESHTHYSIVTVCNWANYQEEEKPIHQPIHQPTINQPSTNHHKQEGKEGKEGKKEKIVVAKFTPPTIEQVTEYCLQRENGVDPERWHSHYSANGWLVGKNKAKMVDWKAAVRTWENTERKSQGANHQAQPKTFSQIKDENMKKAMREWAEGK